MIGTLSTIGALALGAGFVAPRSRQWFLGSVEQDWLANELEFDRIALDQETVLLKSGVGVRVIAIKGQAYETRSATEEETFCAIRSDLFKELAETGVALRLMGLKREIDLSFPADWPCQTLQETGDAEQELTRHSHDLRWFMVLQHRNMGKLDKAVRQVLTALTDLKPAVIRASQEGSCPLTCFVNSLVSGELRDDLLQISSNLSQSLPACDLHLEVSGLIRTYVPHERFSRIVAVRGWPETVTGEIIRDIMAVPGDIEVVQILKPKSAVAAATVYKRKSIELRTPGFSNKQGAEEYDIASEALGNKHVAAFETQFQICVRAASIEGLYELVEHVCEALGRRRVLHSVDTYGAEGKGAAVAWFNRMPGHETLLRPLTLFNAPIAALWTFAASPAGKRCGPFGDAPVRMFPTPSGSSYAFQFHVGDQAQPPGNFLLFAGTGGGKSTLMLHLLSGLAKFKDVRSYVFDSKDGARFMIEAMGGVYQSYEDLALNPLDIAERTRLTDQNLTQIFRAMIGKEWTDKAPEQVAHAIDIAMKLPIGERTLNAIYRSGFSRSAVKTAMANWVDDPDGRSGLYSHIFNAPRDSLSQFLMGAHLVGINMNEALDDPALGPAIVGHIAQKIAHTARTQHGGFGIFVDEAARLLQNDGFRDVVMEMYREYRKFDGFVGLAFQDPKALMGFEGYQAMLENAPTLLFLPNANVSAESLEAFGLTADQIAVVCGRRSGGAKRPLLVVKRDATTGHDESVVLDVDLSAYGDCLRFYRAGTEANRELALLKQQHGTDWMAQL